MSFISLMKDKLDDSKEENVLHKLDEGQIE